MWGRTERTDKLVRTRIELLLKQMEDNGELSSADHTRIAKCLDRWLPLPVDNKTIIDLYAQLQQKEGEALAQNNTTDKRLKKV